MRLALTALLLCLSTQALAAPPVGAGDRVRPQGTNSSFVVPRGWTHGMTQDGAGYAIQAPGTRQGMGAVMLSWTELDSSSRGQSVPALLEASLYELLGGAQYRTELPAEAFQVGGRSGGRVVVRLDSPEGEIEGYLGGVLVDDIAYIVLGVYPAGQASTWRAGADTALGSLDAQPLPQNTALMQRMVGCWEEYNSTSTSGVGFGSSSVKYWFGADGSFSRRSNFNMSAGGASASRESGGRGSWKVIGETLYATADGEAIQWSVEFERGVLYLQGDKALPCD